MGRRRSDAMCLSEIAALNMANEIAYNMNQNELDEEYNLKEKEKSNKKKSKIEKLCRYVGCLYTV